MLSHNVDTFQVDERAHAYVPRLCCSAYGTGRELCLVKLGPHQLAAGLQSAYIIDSQPCGRCICNCALVTVTQWSFGLMRPVNSVL